MHTHPRLDLAQLQPDLRFKARMLAAAFGKWNKDNKMVPVRGHTCKLTQLVASFGWMNKSTWRDLQTTAGSRPNSKHSQEPSMASWAGSSADDAAEARVPRPGHGLVRQARPSLCRRAWRGHVCGLECVLYLLNVVFVCVWVRVMFGFVLGELCISGVGS